ncbi:hypothetical protein GMPD_04460 [Geomonas paludis]|uniref:Uncharacterized protein n=1 Tax=Geomonas paludis TaxID=2740185 RepID=A0A6V8MS04_9BACT|nr:hypothetical protein GMPD_04460 [Geomonas paludis]
MATSAKSPLPPPPRGEGFVQWFLIQGLNGPNSSFRLIQARSGFLLLQRGIEGDLTLWQARTPWLPSAETLTRPSATLSRRARGMISRLARIVVPHLRLVHAPSPSGRGLG